MQEQHKTLADEIADGNPTSLQARWRMRVHNWPTCPLWNHPVARWVLAYMCRVVVCAGDQRTPKFSGTNAVFSAGTFAAALLLSRTPGRLTTLAMIVLSITASTRYMYWRITDTVGFLHWADAMFGFGLLLAELYAFLVLLIGYFQTLGPCSAARCLCRKTWPPGPA